MGGNVTSVFGVEESSLLYSRTLSYDGITIASSVENCIHVMWRKCHYLISEYHIMAV
jgi:hypothetical protein